jgi:hypothetical protein
LRSGYHRRCAEIEAINKALYSGARLRGSVFSSAKVRALIIWLTFCEGALPLL